MIDTRRRRQNAAEVGVPLPVSILPQGSIDTFARVQSGWTYAPFLAPPPTGAGNEEITVVGTIQGAITVTLNIHIGGSSGGN